MDSSTEGGAVIADVRDVFAKPETMQYVQDLYQVLQTLTDVDRPTPCTWEALWGGCNAHADAGCKDGG